MYFPIIDVLKENFIAKIPSIVTQWLTDNVDPVGSAVVVDESLSISGAAADAKVTGDEISELKSDLTDTVQFLLPISHVTGKYINLTGEHDSANFEYYVYEIPSYSGILKFKTNLYGPASVLLSTTQTPSEIIANQYVFYPQTNFISPTDYELEIDCTGYNYVYVSHYVGDTEGASVNVFIKNRVDVIGEDISTLNNNQVGSMTGKNIDITEGKYINYQNGNIGTVAEAGATDIIPVISGKTYILKLSSSIRTDSRGIAFYKDGGFLTGTGIRYISGTTEYTFTVPNGANQMRLTVMLSDEAKGYFSLKAVSNLKELTTFVNSAIDDKIPKTIQNVFAFNTVGIVGDSLASGCSNYKDEQNVWHALDRKNFAWGKFLEKRQGCSVTLFSQGGMSTKTWFTNTQGYAKAQQNPCECYYIGLGVNDYANLGANYLGSISDVNVGNEDTNADSFYGNYSKIIAKLTEIQPRCKIFCFTMPDSQSASQTRIDYDTAIRTVVNLYENAYLLELNGDAFYTSEPVSSTFYGAHYLAVGYSMMADHILDITNEYMLEHIDDFSDIQWITNNYPNVDTVT